MPDRLPIHSPPMRRLVLICMMLLLPVQWTWAAAAAYCAHESGQAAQHMGHHEHQHQGASDDHGGKPATKAVADNDCGVCHLSNLQWLDATVAALPVASEPAPRRDRGAFFRSHIPSGPERPDRARAA